MSNYLHAPQTKLLSTQCVCCGRPLVDAISVQIGMGPECRNYNNANISTEVQEKCNELTCHAALAAQRGEVERIYEYADQIERLGLKVLADKIRKRFVNAKKNVKIWIKEKGNDLHVKTPFRRMPGFVNAWREIEGRKYISGENIIPISSKKQLWDMLKKYFDGFYGDGPKGLFRIVSPDTEDDS